MTAATTTRAVDGPLLIRMAAARLVETRAAVPTTASVREAIREAVSETAAGANTGVLVDEVWDLVEARLDRAGWPTFRTVGGMATELRFIADFYGRELAAAIP